MRLNQGIMERVSGQFVHEASLGSKNMLWLRMVLPDVARSCMAVRAKQVKAVA